MTLKRVLNKAKQMSDGKWYLCNYKSHIKGQKNSEIFFLKNTKQIFFCVPSELKGKRVRIRIEEVR